MEQVRALTDRIKLLKSIAASMREGAIHTRPIPEVDKILALPDELLHASVGAREAVARQVREYEQAFDRLGYACSSRSCRRPASRRSSASPRRRRSSRRSSRRA